MANNPFDREIFYALEKGVSGDFNQLQSNADLELRQLAVDILSLSKDPAVGSSLTVLQPPLNNAGFYASSFRVRSQPGMSVSLDAGLGFYRDGSSLLNIGGVTNVNDVSGVKPLLLALQMQLGAGGIGIIPVGDVANPRIDLIQVKPQYLYADPALRDTLNPGTGVFSSGSLNKTLNYALDTYAQVTTGASIQPVVYKIGTPAAIPVVPATDAGYVAIANVNVAALAISITDADIIDLRRFIHPNGQFKVSGYFTLPAVGPGPINVSMIAPPGMSAAIEWLSGTTASIYLFCGDSLQYSTITGALIPRSVGGANGVYGANATFGSISAYNITAFDATTIATSATVSPNVLVAENQKVIRFQVTLAAEVVPPSSAWYFSIEGQQ